VEQELLTLPVRVTLSNEERTGKCLRQVEHIRGHLWNRYSITVNQVMVATVTFLNFNFNFNFRRMIWGERFVDSFLSFFPVLLVIVLSVLFQYTDSDYPFGIFKLFLSQRPYELCQICLQLRCFNKKGMVSGSCSTSGTRRVNLITNPVISHEWGKDCEVVTTNGTYTWFHTLTYTSKLTERGS
jgi:hypothetical protein